MATRERHYCLQWHVYTFKGFTIAYLYDSLGAASFVTSRAGRHAPSRQAAMTMVDMQEIAPQAVLTPKYTRMRPLGVHVPTAPCAGAWATPLVLPPPTVAPPFDPERAARLPPARQGAVEPYARVEGPDAWLASDFSSPSDFTLELTPRHLAELEAAVRRVVGGGRVAPRGNYLKGVRAHMDTLGYASGGRIRRVAAHRPPPCLGCRPLAACPGAAPVQTAHARPARRGTKANARWRAPPARCAQVTGLTAADFDLPTLGPLLRDVGREVHTGRGFALIRRLPVERWSREEVLVAYWGMGLHW